MIPRKLQQILFQLSQLRKDANGSVHPVAIEAPVVQLHALSKDFVEAGRVRTVLDGIDLSIESGEFVALLGHSGSGKSTLLNLISGIEKPTSGSISIQDVLITELRERERTLFRRDYIGFVFQFFNLIPTLNVLENVTLPQELAGRNSHDLQASAKALLEQVDLADRCDTFPDRLSGGEQQRVAIARALIHDPMLLLADERLWFAFGCRLGSIHFVLFQIAHEVADPVHLPLGAERHVVEHTGRPRTVDHEEVGEPTDHQTQIVMEPVGPSLLEAHAFAANGVESQH